MSGPAMDDGAEDSRAEDNRAMDERAMEDPGEAITDDGVPRPEYVEVLKAVSDLGADELRTRKEGVDDGLRELGVTLKVYGKDEPQVFPLDAVPRIVPADQWRRIGAGIEQRARAMELFLRDVYGPGEIIKAGRVDADMLRRSPGWSKDGQRVPADFVRAGICGLDLVSPASGEWMVLEREHRPWWVWVLVVMTFPIGLLALLIKERERITLGPDGAVLRRGG